MQDFEKESSFRLSLFNHYIYLFYFFTKQVPEFFLEGFKIYYSFLSTYLYCLAASTLFILTPLPYPLQKKNSPKTK